MSVFTTIAIPELLQRRLQERLVPSAEVLNRVEVLTEAMRPVTEFGKDRERLARAIGRVVAEQLVELSALDDRNQPETILRALFHIIADLRFEFGDGNADALNTFDRELLAFANSIARRNPSAVTPPPESN